MGVDELFKITIYIAGGLVALGGGSAVVYKIIKWFQGVSEAKKKIDVIEPKINKIDVIEPKVHRGEILDNQYEIDHDILIELREHNKIQDEIMQCNSDGLQSLLRSKLINLHGIFMKNGSISIIDLENYEHIFDSYKALKGNGLALKLIEDIRKLPVRTEK